MALSRRSGRSRSTLVLLVLISITVITLDFRGGGLIGTVRSGAADALTPVREVADAVLGPVGDGFSGLTRYGTLEEENDSLRARIEELEGDELRGVDAEAELERLLELRGMNRFTDLPTVSARVIGTSASNFEQTIQLDAGGEDGVAEDMPVVTGAGLTGRVVDVSRTRSVVRLVSDPTSSVGVRLSGSGDLGVAEGAGPGRPLDLGLVDLTTAVAQRELVFTSGVDDSFFPGGIPVGRVERVSSVEGELEQEVVIEPVVDLARLRFVEVLRTDPS